MGIQDIIEVLNKYGWKGFLISSIIFLIGVILKTSWFSTWWSKLTDKIVEFFIKKKIKEFSAGEISESDIINHDIFNI